MLFKVINNDKVKILIEKEDIKNFEKICFDNDCEDTKKAIAVLLIGIYEQTGLNFLNNSVFVESVKGYSDTYYIIITRLKECNKNNSDSEEVDMYLFIIENIEDILDLSKKFIAKDVSLKYSRLYRYKNKLYIGLYFTPEEIAKKDFDKLISSIEKDYTRCRWSILNDVILNEWGSLICEKVIENIIAAV